MAGKTYTPTETRTSQGENYSASDVTIIFQVPAGQADMILAGTARHESTRSSTAGKGAPTTGTATYPVKTKITFDPAS